MRPPLYRSIARIGVRSEKPDAVVGPPSRPRGSRRPHSDAKLAEVRRLIEQATLTYGEIAARSGVGRASICRWTRDGQWQRPLFAPRATDTVPRTRASAQLKARTLAARLAALAERMIRKLEDSASCRSRKARRGARASEDGEARRASAKAAPKGTKWTGSRSRQRRADFRRLAARRDEGPISRLDNNGQFAKSTMGVRSEQ